MSVLKKKIISFKRRGNFLLEKKERKKQNQFYNLLFYIYLHEYVNGNLKSMHYVLTPQ
jgi:hypothetical protein